MTTLDAAARRDFIGLSAAIAMVGLALGMVLPLSSLRLQAGGADGSLIGGVLALHAVGLVISAPLSTPVVRLWGARRSMIAATMTASLLCVALQATRTWPWQAACLLGLGVLLGLVFNLVEAWLNEVVPPSSRGQWVAIHCTVFTLCQLLGPLWTPILDSQHTFQTCGLCLMLALPAYALLGPSSLDSAVDEARTRSWWQLLQRAPGVVWGTVLFALFDAVVLGMLPLYGHLHGMSDAAALRSSAVVLAGDTSLEWVIGKLGDRYGYVRVQSSCAWILLLSALGLPAAIGSALWWPLLFVMGGAAGGIYVMSLVVCGQRFAGGRLLQMTALLGAAWGLASCAGPLLTGALSDLSFHWALPGVLAFCAVALMAALALEARTHPPQD